MSELQERFQRWADELVDLAAKNDLINFKATKTSTILPELRGFSKLLNGDTVTIPASDYSRLRAALCKVGCGNTPDKQEAALLHDLMKKLEASRGQLLSGRLLDGLGS